MITTKSSGSFKNTKAFFARVQNGSIFSELSAYGQQGVDALSNATPRDSGETANSWQYHIFKKNGKYGVAWYNTHVVDGIPIAIILQYGHGTGTGGYVQGYDYINPAIRPIFDKIADDVWKKVIS